MIRFHKMFFVSAAVALAAACSDSGTSPNPPAPPPGPPPAPPPPAPAPVTSAIITLVTPHTNDGAVLVTLTGPDVATIQRADSQYVLYSRPASAQETRVIVVGNLAAGALFKINLSAPHLLSAYAGTIQQVATRADSIVASTNGYQLTLSP